MFWRSVLLFGFLKRFGIEVLRYVLTGPYHADSEVFSGANFYKRHTQQTKQKEQNTVKDHYFVVVLLQYCLQVWSRVAHNGFFCLKKRFLDVTLEIF